MKGPVSRNTNTYMEFEIMERKREQSYDKEARSSYCRRLKHSLYTTGDNDPCRSNASQKAPKILDQNFKPVIWCQIASIFLPRSLQQRPLLQFAVADAPAGVRLARAKREPMVFVAVTLAWELNDPYPVGTWTAHLWRSTQRPGLTSC